MAEKRRKARRNNFSEAFALMRYDCQSCPHSEIVWNSRDGAIYQGIHCPECGGQMWHIDSGADIYAPNHVPEPGQLVWIDLPESLKRPLAMARIEACRDDVVAQMDGEDYQIIIRGLIHDIQPGSPWLIWWPQKIIGEFVRGRDEQP